MFRFARFVVALGLFLTPLQIRAAEKPQLVIASTLIAGSWIECGMWTVTMFIGDMTGNSIGAAAAQQQLINLKCSW